MLILGGLLVGEVAAIVDLSNGRMKLGEALISIAVTFLLVGGYGLLLLSGALKLYKSKRVGRGLVITGSVLAIPIAVIGIAATYTDATRDGHPAGFVVWMLVVLYTFATLVLAMLPSTGRWIRAKSPKPAAVAVAVGPQGYQPFQGYPPYHG